MKPRFFIDVGFGLFLLICAMCIYGIWRDPKRAANAPLEATWVSEAHDFGVSKSGRVWRQEEWTAAMKGTRELGKWKRVTLAEGSRPVYVLVTDRLPDKAQSDIDLSKGAALLLGGTDLLRRGKFEVNVEDAP